MPDADTLTPSPSSAQIEKHEKAPETTIPKLTFLQLWNMNLGFLGIQFGWGLQMANMSAIFEHLGANAHQIPILWIAAPLTGLIVQPIIGNLSDHTWGPLGRRRPYLLIGALLAFCALILMPHCSTLWMAALMLWLLDMSANTSMVPFRAFVGDLLPKEQRTRGFAMQSIMVGLGAVSASGMPWILNNIFAVNNATSALQRIPKTVQLSFYIGAAIFLGTVLWTIFTTPEHPPKNIARLEKLQEERGGVINSLQETWQVLMDMPPTMRQLAWVQSFTWLGLFCFFLYFPPAVAHNIFGAEHQSTPLYSDGIEWAGLCFAMLNISCAGFSLLLPLLTRRLNRKVTHSLCLCSGGISLISLVAIHNQYMLLLPMVGFGITWSSVQSLPYAMLAGTVPTQRRGIYQGVFNFFVVLPEIAVSIGFGWIMKNLLNEDRLAAVVLGGGFLVVAAVATLFVQVPHQTNIIGPEPPKLSD